MTIIKKIIIGVFILITNLGFSQCFEIESILVDACDSGSNEGFNEMVRIKTGDNLLSTNNLDIDWPSNSWKGIIQNATTASKVAQLNTDIAAAGGCGQILEPNGGVIPPNSTVIIVTSFNLNTILNSFGALTTDIYMIFQNNTNTTSGHFANYNTNPGTRSLSIDFGGGCSDTVTYQRANLTNIYGTYGGTTAENNGATVNFTPSGTPSYVNNGCTAPIPPFTVDAGNATLTVCPGETINLSGNAQGHESVLWTASSGVFSSPNTLPTNYTVPNTAVTGSTITVTLTATNTCGASISDDITLTVSGSTLTLNSANNNQTICSGDNIASIEYTFGGGATSADVTGLPAGVTATTTGNTVTINGNPTTNFNYTISTVGGCQPISLSGTIVVNSNATLTLLSDNNDQTVCVGNTIDPIEYTFENGATSVNVTGLPAGVTATTTGNAVTISGNSANSFNYTISTVGGCGTATLNGNITIEPNATLVLNSANNNQTICSGDNIASIEYTFGGGATSADVTGLPAGVTATTTGNTVTINGNPTTNFNYTISTVGGCQPISLSGTIVVNSNATLTLLSDNNDQTVCVGNTIDPIEYTFENGATSVNVTGLPAGVTATTTGNAVTISGNSANSFNYTISTVGGCGTATLNGNITIEPNATLVLNSANNNQTICSGDNIASIEYTFGGGATSADVTGLPAGVTATTTGNTVTINGNPTTNFNYTISTVGGCQPISLSGTIVVNSNATLTLLSDNNDQTVCVGNTIDPIEYTFENGATSVNVTGLPAGVTATTTGNAVTISGNSANSFNYTISTVGGCGTATLNGNITIEPNATLVLNSANNNQTICSGDNIASIEYTFGGGATSADVTGLPAGVTATTTGNTVTINGNPTTNFNYTISTVGGCQPISLSGTIVANPLPEPILKDGTICITNSSQVYQPYTLDTELPTTGYSFEWYKDGLLISGANEPIYVANAIGLYSVIVTNTTTLCSSEEVFATVSSSHQLDAFTTILTDAFSDNTTITVLINGNSETYLYQLDEGAFQESNIFTNVSAGEHTITVTDTAGCTYITQTILVIDYPKFFTPNGDGYNDTWNIVGLNQSNAKLYIFDRYGKLIKQLSTSETSKGWDGTYNGHQLPSTDYWFSLDYLENGNQKQFKAHFSLKR